MLAMQVQELLDIGADVVTCSSTEDIVVQAKAATGEQAMQRSCFLCCSHPHMQHLMGQHSMVLIACFATCKEIQRYDPLNVLKYT